MPKFTRIPTEDVDLIKLQHELERVLRGVSDNPLLAGRLLTVEVSASEYKNFAHGLSRQAQGWFLVSPKASVTVWEDPAYPAGVPVSMLRLKSSADATLKVWVF